jgi:hypothetical protein
VSCVGLEGRAARWQEGIVVSRVQRGRPRGPGWGRHEEAKVEVRQKELNEGGERGRVLGVPYARATRDSGGEIYTGSLQPSAVPLPISFSLSSAMNTQVTRRVEPARQERYREGVASSPSGRKSPITHRFEIRGRRSIIESALALRRRAGRGRGREGRGGAGVVEISRGGSCSRKNARIGSLIAVANLTRRNLT